MMWLLPNYLQLFGLALVDDHPLPVAPAARYNML